MTDTNENLISRAEWESTKQTSPVPGWGVPNAEIDPQGYATWCEANGVRNEYA